jgi:mRNA-degrading endonuclease toxin of MazEF toxin-antitoxin module
MEKQKDYSLWHKLKTWIHNEEPRVFFHERQIWFCSLGENVGFEQDGKGQQFLRPVVIIRKFNNQIFWAAPLTSKIKKSEYYFEISFDGKKNSAILSQLRLIDAKRLRYKIGVLSEDQFLGLTKNLKDLIP